MSELLSDGVRDQVKNVFKDLKNPVVLILFLSQSQNCEYCEQTRQLLEEVISLNSLLSLEVHDREVEAVLAKTFQVDKAPGIVVAGRDGIVITDFGVRFYGIPAGSEFTTLIHDLLLVSKRDSGLTQDTRDFLQQLDKPVHLQVFVTPT